VSRPAHGLLGAFQQQVVDVLAQADDLLTVEEIAAALDRDRETGRRQVRHAVDQLEEKGITVVHRRRVLGWTQIEGDGQIPRAGSLIELTEQGRSAARSHS
jgi:repressor of nif and glnA expression